jgi:hypothetical protein
LFLLMTVVAVWLGRATYQAQQQARAVNALSPTALYQQVTPVPVPEQLCIPLIRNGQFESLFRQDITIR